MYNKTNWDSNTPINVENLNKIEQGIYDLSYNTPSKTSKTTTIPAVAGWYRIATSAVNIGKNQGVFSIKWTTADGTFSGRVLFTADINLSGVNAEITQISFACVNTSYTISHARIVYHSTSTGNYAYLDINNNQSTYSFNIIVDMIEGEGWTLLDSVAGSIPSGYTSTSVAFMKGIVTNGNIAVGNNTMVSNLNANYLGGKTVAQLIDNTSSIFSGVGTWNRLFYIAQGTGRYEGIIKLGYSNNYVRGEMSLLFSAFNNGQQCGLQVLGHTTTDITKGITKVRYRYHETLYASNYAYIDFYYPNPDNANLIVYWEMINPSGLTNSASSNVSIASGYTVKEFVLNNGSAFDSPIKIDNSSEAPLQITSAIKVDNLNADMLDGQHLSDISKKLRNGGV